MGGSCRLATTFWYADGPRRRFSQVSRETVIRHMRLASTISAIMLLGSAASSLAETPIVTAAERRLLLAVPRALEERLYPEVSRDLWLRYSQGSGPHERSEFSISFVRGPRTSPDDPKESFKLSVVLRKARGSMLKQMGSYFESNPMAPVEAAISAVQVTRADYHEDECAAVRAAYESYWKVAAAALVPPKYVGSFYHGASIQIEGYTDDVFFRFHVQEGNALFDWAMKSADSIEACPPS